MNVGDLRRNSGECQGDSHEYGVMGSPKFAKLRQSSHEGARMLPVHPGTCLTYALLNEGKLSGRFRESVKPGNENPAQSFSVISD